MAAPVLHLGATIRCSHAGLATPVSSFQRVLVSGQPVVTISTMYVVTNCTLAGTHAPPCSTGRWLSGATRVQAGGAPVATFDGASRCEPTGTPMLPVTAQTRVMAR
jgi:hypothetical protein